MSNISVDFDVLNQKGSPAWFTDTFANIPTAGFVGRMFISKDTFAFYRDTGSGWDLIGGPGIGTLTGSGAVGQVSFFNGTQVLAGNNNLFWDNTNSRLGINNSTPTNSLDVIGTGKFTGVLTLGSTISNGTNSYTLPSATGTIAILEAGTQTFTGTLNVLGSLGTKYGISIEKGNTPSPLSFNDIFIYALSGATNIINFANSSYISSFSFPTSNQTFTFPATTGTIALTSDLSSYVSLGTTQTITANKTFSEFGFFDKGVLLKQNIYPSASGYNGIGAIGGGFYFSLGQTTVQTLLFSTTTPFQYTFPSATGTIALTSNLSSYLPLTGGTLTGALVINPTNTNIIGLDVASNTTIIRSDNLEGFKRQLEITMGSGTLVQLVAKGYGANYGTDLAFYTATTSGTNASPAIYITGTNNRIGIKTGLPAYDLDVSGTFGVSGAAAFSSSVTVVFDSGITFGSRGAIKQDASFNYVFSTNSLLNAFQITPLGVGTFASNVVTSTYFNANASTRDIYLNASADLGQGSLPTIQVASAHALQFATSNLLRATISSAGQLFVGTTLGLGGTMVIVNRSGQHAISVFDGQNNGKLIDFFNSSAVAVGSITQNGTSTQYNTTSDYRLKEDLKEINGIEKVTAIKVYNYKWKNSILRMDGVLAHELAEVIPYAVTGIKDAKDMQSVDYSKLVPIMVKAIQELNDKLIKNNIN